MRFIKYKLRSKIGLILVLFYFSLKIISLKESNTLAVTELNRFIGKTIPHAGELNFAFMKSQWQHMASSQGSTAQYFLLMNDVDEYVCSVKKSLCKEKTRSSG